MEKVEIEKTPTISEQYLARIKRELFAAYTTLENRQEILGRIIDNHEWYLKLRKSFESDNSDQLDKFLDEQRKDPAKYKRFNDVYGFSGGDKTPKFSIHDLELFIQEIKHLSLEDNA